MPYADAGLPRNLVGEGRARNLKMRSVAAVAVHPMSGAGRRNDVM